MIPSITIYPVTLTVAFADGESNVEFFIERIDADMWEWKEHVDGESPPVDFGLWNDEQAQGFVDGIVMIGETSTELGPPIPTDKERNT